MPEEIIVIQEEETPDETPAVVVVETDNGETEGESQEEIEREIETAVDVALLAERVERIEGTRPTYEDVRRMLESNKQETVAEAVTESLALEEAIEEAAETDEENGEEIEEDSAPSSQRTHWFFRSFKDWRQQ